MKGGSIIMIGGGVQHVEAVKIVQGSGHRSIVTDRSPNAPCFPYADHNVVIDGRDIEGLVSYALLNKEKLDIKGVFTLTELVTSVAAVSEGAKLPGVLLQSAVICQNKLLCKKIWNENGVPTPSGEVVDSFRNVERKFNDFGGKIFVKPVVGFGGAGSKKITSKRALAIFINENKPINHLLIEKLEEGTMHDVNAVFDAEGNFFPLGSFDRFFQYEHPVEIGACYPSQLDKKSRDALYRVTEEACRAVGINFGPVKADLVKTAGGVKVLEIAPRFHGPKGTLFLTSFSGGTNHLEAALPIITGQGTSKQSWRKPLKVSVYRALLPEAGFIKKISGSTEAIKDGAAKVLLFSNRNISIQGYYDSRDVPGYVFASGLNYEDANSNLERAMRRIWYKY